MYCHKMDIIGHEVGPSSLLYFSLQFRVNWSSEKQITEFASGLA